MERRRLIFLAEIKKTIEQFSFDIELNNLINSVFLFGKNPQKKYLSEKPLIDTAVTTAEGPGIG